MSNLVMAYSRSRPAAVLAVSCESGQKSTRLYLTGCIMHVIYDMTQISAEFPTEA